MSIIKTPFGKTKDGQETHLYIFSNKNKSTLIVTDYGGAIVSIVVPDKNGNLGDVVLGFDSTIDYECPTGYIGALIGRVANRTANAAFVLGDKNYHIGQNDGKNSLHGGIVGFDKKVWKAKIIDDETLQLQYISPNMEEGFPGNLTATVEYSWGDNNALSIKYKAITDAPTPCNLTNHCYFNLAGKGDNLSHLIQINASCFTPINAEYIPTGKIETVINTPFDFRVPHTIGERINEMHPQLKNGNGYDHNFCVDGNGMREFAKVIEPTSGRVMTVLSDAKGVQFYSGNFLTGTKPYGKGGTPHTFRSAFCLETQYYPNSLNEPNFESPILYPNTTWHSQTIYAFEIYK